MNLTRVLPLLAVVDKISQRAYRRVSAAVLRLSGVKLEGVPLWVSSRVYWDLSRPGIISLGDRCVISHGVRLLTHDFSLDRVAERRLGQSDREKSRVAGIKIGRQAFVGMGAMILPGVTIGDGAIIGAGAVVTNDVPADSVAAGNPARILATTDEYWRRRSAEF